MRRNIAIGLVLCVSLFVIEWGSVVSGVQDSDQQTSTITLIIEPACKLAISDEAVSETLVKDDTAETAFDFGYVELDPNKPTLEISSNKQWKLSAMVTSSTGPYDKKTKDFQLKSTGSPYVTNGFDDYKPLSDKDQEIASYNQGVKSEEYPCQYRILLDWKKDVPGTYETTVTYTLSTSGA